MSDSRVIRSAAGGWSGIEPARYKDEREGPGCFLGATRHTLLGATSDGPADGLNFEVRYFELEPGGYSSLERHEHPHAVMILKGRGRVRLGNNTEPVGPFDIVYVAPGEVHRLSADSAETLGFLCIVDRERDRPVAVPEEEGARKAAREDAVEESAAEALP